MPQKPQWMRPSKLEIYEHRWLSSLIRNQRLFGNLLIFQYSLNLGKPLNIPPYKCYAYHRFRIKNFIIYLYIYLKKERKKDKTFKTSCEKKIKTPKWTSAVIKSEIKQNRIFYDLYAFNDINQIHMCNTNFFCRNSFRPHFRFDSTVSLSAIKESKVNICSYELNKRVFR